MDIQDRGGRPLSQRRTRAHAKGRTNGDGSFYQTKDGLWRGVAYVRTPTGEIKRKYVSSKDRDQARRKWVALVNKANSGQPVDVSSQRLDAYLPYWLDEVIKPWRRHNAYAMYETSAPGRRWPGSLPVSRMITNP